ncbi:PHD finger protein ALFIN-LIKE 1-like [Archocentrus centrarchus]|uniref:PHD finger protein ALFIN-LIKE 1-like n=1 Tax=Archocentrus centrarchus TaxID=63155 RepID=UPI0011E9C810|nr:PHD finger protein ALFIN-LIKE 1-like [Archocentrus centrarchus]
METAAWPHLLTCPSQWSFMRHRGLNPSRWACDTLPHPKQLDAVSCGAYVLKFAECILADVPVEFDNSASGVTAIRHHIAISLLENTDDLTDLCHYCGNRDGDNHWIGCDARPRWYHKSCVKKPRMSKHKKFFCKACQ